jgi:MFS family permease
MAATDDLVVTPGELVADEKTRRPRAGLAALGAAIVTVGANVVQNATLSDRPRVTEIDALRDAAGQPLGRAGLGTDQVLYMNDHAAGLLLGAVLQATVSLLTGFVLLTLLRATLDRAGRTPRFTRQLIIIGAVGAAVGTLLLTIGLVINASDFAGAADHGTQAAHDAARSGVLIVSGTILGLIGLFPLAAAFVMVAIAAMRVGLLTRFVGVLGAIVGVLQILGPLSAGSFIVTAFWMAMVGALLLGRWPQGMPPAWDEGEARPWPTQQEIREQRERNRAAGGGRRGGRGGGGLTTTPAPASGPVDVLDDDGAPSAATSARKKRKRRG